MAYSEAVSMMLTTVATMNYAKTGLFLVCLGETLAVNGLLWWCGLKYLSLTLKEQEKR